MKNFYLWVFIFSTSVFAQKTHYIFIDAGNGPNDNHKTYYNEVRHGYEVGKSKGSSAHIFAKDGSWKLGEERDTNLSNFALTAKGRANKNSSSTKEPSYPPIIAPASSLSQLKKDIAKLGVGPKDKVVISINGHGNQTSIKNNPKDATLMLWGEEVKWKDFQQVLNVLPSSSKKKLTTNICYGGGVHYLSHVNKNVCSSSVVPGFTESSSGLNFEGMYSTGFWDKVKKDKTPSLFEASVDGFSKDRANAGLGNLSSMDYIDRVLARGQYDPNNKKKLEQKIIFDTQIYNQYGDAIHAYLKDEDYNGTGLIDAILNEDCFECFEKEINNIYKSFQKFAKLSLSPRAGQAIKKISGVFPITHAYNQKFSAVKNYLKHKNIEIKALEEAWQSAVDYEKKSGVSKLFAKTESVEETEMKLNMAKNEKKMAMKKYLKDVQLMNMYLGIAEFYNKVTDENTLKKFEDLLACELASF
jgi:hypothetical protein